MVETVIAIVVLAPYAAVLLVAFCLRDAMHRLRFLEDRFAQLDHSTHESLLTLTDSALGFHEALKIHSEGISLLLDRANPKDDGNA